jgi:AbrB family looped-hinge helix DNA binding protein
LRHLAFDNILYSGSKAEREIMATTVTEQGQVTIPKDIRDFLGIGPGSAVDFKHGADGQIVLVPSVESRQPGRFARFRGHAKDGLSSDEIMNLTRGEE